MYFGISHDLYYLRASNGEEIALIIDRKQYCELIAVKSGETFTPKMVKTLLDFATLQDKMFLLYNGVRIAYRQT